MNFDYSFRGTTGQEKGGHNRPGWRAYLDFRIRGSYDDHCFGRQEQHYSLWSTQLAGRSYRFSNRWRGGRRLGNHPAYWPIEAEHPNSGLGTRAKGENGGPTTSTAAIPEHANHPVLSGLG